MADIDKITVNNTTYNIKDSTARDSISQSCYNLLAATNIIESGSDLNSFTTPGKYACVSSAAAASYTNSPVRVPFYMHVEYGTNESYVVQHLRPTKMPWSHYVRVKDVNTWTSWHLMSSTEV